MISWIQRTFQRHFAIIFGIILVAMVIPFIFTIGSTPGIGRADHKAQGRDFFGHNLMAVAESSRLATDAHLSAELQYGGNASAEQIQSYMLQRTAALHLADELHLPSPSQADITDFIKNLRIFAGADGQFDASRYDAFRTSFKSRSVVNEADIYRVISDDVRISRLQRLLAGPGYVLPSDVRTVVDKGDTQWTVATATADYATFDPDLTVSDTEVAKFFSDNTFRYTVGPRVVVDAVQFPASAYLGQATATDEEVKAFYDANPGRFPAPAPAKGTVAKPNPAADYAAVQPQVRQAVLVEIAKRSAVKAASDLAYSLYEGKVTRDSLPAFLAAHHLRADSLAPFTAEAGPLELGGDRDLATAAFELNADRFYSEGLPSQTGAVVLVWKASLPSHDPTFVEVAAKVRADALDNKKRLRFVEFGRALQAGTTRGLKAGLPFEKAATAAADGTKLTFKTFPPFTLQAQPRDLDPAIYSVLDTLDQGSVSAMEATADKGVIVYAAQKKVPASDPANPRYQQVRQMLAGQFAQATATSEMREIVDDELKRSEAAAK
jgi:peptidyl-prolyl cis-trans isomerase D